MSVDVLKVVMDLDDRGFRQRLLSNSKEIARNRKTLLDTNKTLIQTQRHHRSWMRSIRDVTVAIQGMHYTLVDIAQVTVGWQKKILDVNAELERGVQVMRNFSKETSQAAIDAEANASLDSIIQRAKEAPFSIKALQDSFVKLKVGGIDETKRGFEALTEGVAAFGGTDETLKRASIAIQQMGGKGVVSMEELRQQLGEAMPQAARMMARGLGMEYGKMVKLISEGRINAQPALQAMLREMELSTTGAADAMMNTWTGQMARMNTEFTLLAKSFGDSGYFKEAKDQLKEFNAYLGTGEMKEWMKDLGKSVTEIMKSVISGIKAIVPYIGLIGKLIAAFIGIKTVAALWKGFGSIIDGLKTRAAAFNASMNAQLATSTAASTAHIEALRKQQVAVTVAENNAKNAKIQETRRNAKAIAEINAIASARRAAGTQKSLWDKKAQQATVQRLKNENALRAAIAQRAIAEKNAAAASALSTLNTTKATTSLIGAQNGFTRAINATKVAMIGLGSTIGMIGATVLIGWVANWYAGKKAIQENIDKLLEIDTLITSKKDLDTLKAKREEIKLLKEEFEQIKKNKQAGIDVYKEKGFLDTDERRWVAKAEEFLEGSGKKIKEYENQLTKLDYKINDSAASVFESTIASYVNSAEEAVKSKMKGISSSINNAMTELELHNKQGLFKDGQYSKARDAIKAARQLQVKALYDEQLESVKKILKISDLEEASKRRIIADLEKIRDLEANKDFSGSSTDAIIDKNTDATTLINTMAGFEFKIEQLKAKIEGVPNSFDGWVRKLKLVGKEGTKEFEDLKAAVEQINLLTNEAAQKTKAESQEKALTSLINKYQDLGKAAQVALDTKSGEDGGLLSGKYTAKATSDLDAYIRVLDQLKTSNNITKKSYTRLLASAKTAQASVTDAGALKDVASNFTRITKLADGLAAKLVKTKEGTREYYAEQTRMVQSALDNLDMTAQGADKLFGALIRYKELIAETVEQKTLSGTTKMIEQWKNLDTLMDNMANNTITTLADSFSDFLTTGKANFKDFSSSIIKMITKMIVKLMIAKALTAMLGGGGADNKAAMGGSADATNTHWTNANPDFYANGGVMTKFGRAQYNAYQNGGIQKARTPKLALFGEGSMNEAYVPLPDGKTIPVTMKGGIGNGDVDVNIINQSGQQVSGQASKSFDGEKMIIDVLLKSITSPGPVRESIKGVR